MMDIASEPARRSKTQFLILFPVTASLLLVIRLLADAPAMPAANEAGLWLTALAASALSFVAAFRSAGQTGRPWLLAAAGCLGWAAWYLIDPGSPTGHGLAQNAGYVVLVGSTIACALMLSPLTNGRGLRRSALVDLLPPSIALIIAIWSFCVGAFVLDDRADDWMRVTAVLHGLGSVALLVTGVAGTLGQRRRGAVAAEPLLFAAIAAFAFADVAWLYHLTGSTGLTGAGTTAVAPALVLTGISALVAARSARTDGRGTVEAALERGWESQSANLALGALLLIAGGQAVFGERTAHGLVTALAGALLTLGFIVARQSIALRRERTLRQEIGQLSDQIDGLISQVGRDPLTGLLNHRAIHERIDHELALGRAGGHPVAVALIDVDNFKTVNDTLGHQSGDRVLRAVSSILTAACRGTDVAARYAGDEFMLLLPGLNEAHAGSVCERIAHEVNRVNADLNLGPSVTISLSVGVAVTHGCQRSVAQTVAIADAAMYDAKESGKNRVVVVNADSLTIAETRAPSCSPDRLMAESRGLFWSPTIRRAG